MVALKGGNNANQFRFGTLKNQELGNNPLVEREVMKKSLIPKPITYKTNVVRPGITGLAQVNTHMVEG